MTKNSVDLKFYFAHPPEKVWEYLTKSELMAEWLMENNFLPVEGHEFQFRVKPMPAFQFDGVIYCKVLEIIPFSKLSYSWKSGPGNGEMTVDSVVEWTLRLADGGAALYLLHSGFKEENLSMCSIIEQGWETNVSKIIGILNDADDGQTSV